MNKNFFIIGSILAGLAVLFGAYGAHAGKEYLSNESVSILEKAVKYQMTHSIALLIVSIASAFLLKQKKLLLFVGLSFLFGIIFFSGSIYIIVFANLKMGFVTPIGGLLFVIGWFLLAFTAFSAKKNE